MWVVDEKVAVVPDERIEVRVCDRWHRAGWIYSPNSGRIRPNSGGRSSEGIRWYEF